MSSGPTFVYVLRDPESSEIRYVGLTNNPPMRLEKHLKGKCGPFTKAWIRALRRRNLVPVMDVQYVGRSRQRARLAEYLLIAELRKLGARLTNMTCGGEP